MRFDASAGWVYKDVTIDGKRFQYPVSLASTPHNVSYIWFAPNHVRVFPRDAYTAAGGYDPQRTVLDDQDLMCRLYQMGPFHLIDDCLYLQRMHDHNTQKDAETNAFIQQETIALYDRTSSGTRSPGPSARASWRWTLARRTADPTGTWASTSTTDRTST